MTGTCGGGSVDEERKGWVLKWLGNVVGPGMEDG